MKRLDDLREQLAEEQLHETQQDPPNMIVFRRKAIRVFPGDQRVALYVNDSLGLEVSIPYTPGQIGGKKLTAGLKESAHDELFGQYIRALGTKHTLGQEHVRRLVVKKYGDEAFGHFHNAAAHYVNKDENKASAAYQRFERHIAEEIAAGPGVVPSIIGEGAIHKVHHIAKSRTAGDVIFANGASSKVDPVAALKVMKLHAALNPQNKQKIEKLVNSGPDGLSRVCDFADKNMKQD